MNASFRRVLFLFALLIVALPLAAQVLTPHDVARIRSVGEVAISPDGKWVAYTLSVPRQPLVDEDGAAWSELHVAGPDGASRPFVTGRVNVSRLAWLPDGKSIAFLARRPGDRATSLYLISNEGGEARKVLEHETSISGYAFCPDGHRVAFLAAEAVPAARRSLREKGFNQEIYEEDVAFVRVWVAELGSSQKPEMLKLDGSASALTWSPVGHQIAVALAPTPLTDDDYMRRKLHVVDLDTGKVVARIENPGKLGDVVWSPDGQNLAIIAAGDINDSAAARLMVVPASGGKPREVLPDCPCDVADVAWLDVNTLMYIRDEGVWTSFERIRRDGTERKTLIANGGPILTAVSLSKDGLSAAFVAQTPVHPSELYWMKHGDSAPTRVTNSNLWLAQMKLAAQEVVKFKARDGLELEGMLIRPLDEQRGQRYPLILVVHGGPESHYTNGWLTSYSSPGQVAAGRGFAVFYPNYRGSTGRGRAFVKLSFGDPAGKEFDDLVDGVDHLVTTGLAEKAKVGITGGSYGGYASAWGATYYSERFAASVMFVGISDEISKMGATDIPWEMYDVHFGYWPWENKWQHTLERSPVYYAGKSRTPTLILGGTDDPRVPPGQSMELYRHLKLGGQAPVRLVRYPGEQHGNRRAASRLDYSLRMMQWLEHYLKGPGGAPPPFEISYEEPKK